MNRILLWIIACAIAVNVLLACGNGSATDDVAQEVAAESVAEVRPYVDPYVEACLNETTRVDSAPVQEVEIEPAPVAVTPIKSRHSDAYEEGYEEGYDQGYEDGETGQRYYSGYDDRCDYKSRRLIDQYEDGYADGYDEGYSEGHNVYMDENDDEEDP